MLNIAEAGLRRRVVLGLTDGLRRRRLHRERRDTRPRSARDWACCASSGPSSSTASSERDVTVDWRSSPTTRRSTSAAPISAPTAGRPRSRMIESGSAPRWTGSARQAASCAQFKGRARPRGRSASSSIKVSLHPRYDRSRPPNSRRRLNGGRSKGAPHISRSRSGIATRRCSWCCATVGRLWAPTTGAAGGGGVRCREREDRVPDARHRLDAVRALGQAAVREAPPQGALPRLLGPLPERRLGRRQAAAAGGLRAGPGRQGHRPRPRGLGRRRLDGAEGTAPSRCRSSPTTAPSRSQGRLLRLVRQREARRHVRQVARRQGQAGQPERRASCRSTAPRPTRPRA